MDTEINKPVKLKKHRRRKPTVKQIKALQYMNQGMSGAKAMRMAGYSHYTSLNVRNNLLSQPSVKDLILGMSANLLDAGLGAEYITDKFKEWFEAQKPIAAKILVTKDGKLVDADAQGAIEVPDYDVQVKAYDRWKKIMDDQANPAEGRKVKRKMTIEEFVTGEENT